MTHDACPHIITPGEPGERLEDWVGGHRDTLEPLLLQHKALLFRSFANRGGLDSIAGSFFKERLTYTYRSTPRTNLGQYVYTATEYPCQLSIPQHCENAYQRTWPMKLLFHCVQPAVRGGQTPLADMVQVTRAIDPQVQEKFRRKGVKYVRNYRAGVDLPWEEVFGSNSKEEVEMFCEEHGLTWEWLENGLRTTQVCQAFATHPRTGETVWFNQAHLFHLSALRPEERKMMLFFFKEEGLPRNAYYGDGSPIEEEVLTHVRAAFEANRIRFDWHRDDVLLLDNMLVSHGRDPYEGNRKVLVCMAEAHSAAEAGSRRAATGAGELVKLHV